MKYKGIIKKSRTMDYALLLVIFGTVLQALPMVQDQLQGNYGFIFMGLSIITAVLRAKTTQALGDK